jgi:hypothetical protein
MKPLNANENSCDPVSSNCVIWQGPDIPCLSLCNGDSVSNVMYKMATEMCDIMKTLNISSYDLSCFNLKLCPPETFTQLIQFLMERVCSLESCTGCRPDCDGNASPNTPPTVGPGCPDCEVNVAPCFYFTNQLGDQVTSMQLQDYVHAIGNKICGIIDGTITIQAIIQNQGARIKQLEDTPPPSLVLPSITPACVLPQQSTSMDAVLTALELQFCQLRSATGLPNQLYQSIDTQPNGLTQAPALSFPGTMGSIPGWVSNVTNVADTITNMWLTIDDMRKAIMNIKTNCCPSGCDGLVLSLSGYSVDSSNIKLYINGTIPPGFIPCTGDTLFTISDTLGNSFQYPINIPVYLNNPNGVPINLTTTPVNGNSNLTVNALPCFKNDSINATCQSSLSFYIENQNNCPSLVLTQGLTSIGYGIALTTANTTYTVELWNSTNSALLQSFVHSVVSPTSISGTFSGLSSGTVYNVRVKVMVGTIESTCPFNSISTLPPLCPAPTSVISTLDY